MKRSDMIELIAQKLERCHDRYGNLLDFKFVSNEILEDMEEAGMQPPTYLKKSKKKEVYEIRHGANAGEWEEYYPASFVNKWEPENEE